MSRESVELLIDRWINEPAFREEFQRDPEGTVARSGLSLTEQEWEDLRRMEASVAGEALQARVSKPYFG